jgi:hypothetical protein
MNELRPAPDDDHLYERVTAILDEARSRVARTVNTAMVHAYWFIGREIVEVSQQGAERAGYGDDLLKKLATRLTGRFGKGFTLTSLKRMRQFYRAFPEGSALPIELGGPDKGAPTRHLFEGEQKGASLRHLSPAALGALFPPILSWTHYRLLVSVERAEVAPSTTSKPRARAGRYASSSARSPRCYSSASRRTVILGRCSRLPGKASRSRCRAMFSRIRSSSSLSI